MFSRQGTIAKCLASKRDQYRVHIRRQEVSQMIRVKRETMMEDIMEGAGETELVLHSIATQMGQQPKQSWISHLSILQKIQITRKDANLWVQFGLVTKLLKLMKEQYRDLDPEFEAANIISKLLNTDQANSELERAIIQCDCAKSIVQTINKRIDSQENCFETIENVLFLLGNLCFSSSQFRFNAAQQGIIQSIIKLSHQARTQDSHITVCWLMRNICRSHQQQPLGLSLTYNQISAFQPILCQQMKSQHSEVLKLALQCLLTLIDETQYKVSSLFYVESLRKRVLQLAKLERGSGQGLLSQRLLGYMCSCSNPTFASRLVQEGILDSLESGLRNLPTIVQPLREICWILTNIVINSTDDCHIVFRHSIFENILDLCCDPIPERKTQVIVALLHKIISSLTVTEIAEMLQKTRTVEALVTSINRCQTNHKIVLNSLESILVILKEVGRINKQKYLIEQLEKTYNFNRLLEDLVTNQNKAVSDAAQKQMNYIQLKR